MTIQEKIDADLKDAMRAKAVERLGVLRMVKAAFLNMTIERHGAGGKLSDADANAVLRKQVKQRLDSIDSFEKGGRPELADKERREIEVLNDYLPKALTENEISALVQASIAEVKATSKGQMGAVMKVATQKAEGRIDGKTLIAAIQKALG
jgi:uncharacterized protein